MKLIINYFLYLFQLWFHCKAMWYDVWTHDECIERYSGENYVTVMTNKSK